jgi:hypothetical protein
LWYFHVCIITPIGLSPLIFFIPPQSLSYGSFQLV